MANFAFLNFWGNRLIANANCRFCQFLISSLMSKSSGTPDKANLIRYINSLWRFYSSVQAPDFTPDTGHGTPDIGVPWNSRGAARLMPHD
jgi:hypothetical protein